MSGARHKWGEKLVSRFKTERECSRCEMVKTTRHDDPNGRAWCEFWRDIEQIRSEGTPPCDARRERAAAEVTP